MYICVVECCCAFAYVQPVIQLILICHKFHTGFDCYCTEPVFVVALRLPMFWLWIFLLDSDALYVRPSVLFSDSNVEFEWHFVLNDAYLAAAVRLMSGERLGASVMLLIGQIFGHTFGNHTISRRDESMLCDVFGYPDA